jgi:simple sugar transport system ATP-binding protein
VTILRDGTLVGSFDAGALTRPKLISLMVGREFEPATSRGNGAGAMTEAGSLLSLRGFGRAGMVESVDADVAQGGVVGLAGLLGSGRSETARLVFGADTATRGTMSFRGKASRFTTPRQAIASGIGMLPENRKEQGVFPSLSVVENLVVSLRARDGAFAKLSFRAQVALAEEFVRLLGIKTPDVHARISGLSGGNQQKVLLARWFATRPVLLILDEPTRGIDIAAKADVLRAVDRLRAEGTAVLFISSELEEVTRICGRVVVLRDRRSVAHLEGSEITEQAVLAAVAQTT